MNNIKQFKYYLTFILLAGLFYCGQLQASDEKKQLEADLRERDRYTEQIYNSLRFADSMYKFELSSVWVPDPLKSKYKEICGPGSFDLYCETKNSIEVRRLTDILKTRAASGDSVAMFYMGLQTIKTATTLNSTEDYEKAATYYKQACSAGVADGCWNVGAMYADGTGVINRTYASRTQLAPSSDFCG